MATGQYIGVNGVARKVTSPYIGVNGVARNVKSGYVGVDGVARLFFAPESGEPVILEVEKVTANTYANQTSYTAEEFILLDIYPKPGGTVNVTYGGLTKTITDTSGAEEPNAQKVFFGTFNGVTDSVATPSSGELTIKGDYTAFATGIYTVNEKIKSEACGCIKGVSNFGTIETLSKGMFRNCDSLTDMILVDNTKSIPEYTFSGCDGFTSIVVPEGITDIGAFAFEKCNNLVSIILPSTLKTIGTSAIWKNLSVGPEYTVTVLATTPPTFTGDDDGHITQNTGTSKATIVVPKGCKDVYEAANGWKGTSILPATIVEAT